MRVDLTPCVILHRRAWRDTSLIVEAFSREYGRIALIAKGARRAKARWRGLLEPLACLQLAWSGRGEMYSLTDAEPVQRHVLGGNALMAGFYASELVMRLTARDDPHPPLYDSFDALLDGLGEGAPSIVALRFFERDLLDEVGYGIALDATTDTGEEVTAAHTYLYHPDAGLRRASGPARADEVRIEGSALIGLVNGRFGHREDIRAARDLMRAAIAPHLGNRPLKSVQTLQAMQQFRAAGSSDPAANTSSGESP